MKGSIQNVNPSKGVCLVVCLNLYQVSAQVVLAGRSIGVDEILSSSLKNVRSITNYKMECDANEKGCSITDSPVGWAVPTTLRDDRERVNGSW